MNQHVKEGERCQTLQNIKCNAFFNVNVVVYVFSHMVIQQMCMQAFQVTDARPDLSNLFQSKYGMIASYSPQVCTQKGVSLFTKKLKVTGLGESWNF